MSYGDITIFERNLANWEVAHPRLCEYGGDAAIFISAQTDRIVYSQLKAADRIVVSQERIASGIDKVAFGIDRVADGLGSLASAFEWGTAELVWQLEQHREILKEILKVLQAPLDTQAKELKRRAENAYKNGWIDEALDDFLESEKKNRYDFTIHISLGNIYFFEKKNPEKALDCYEKAVKYATPKSSYHASYALLHIGLIKYLQGNFEEAHESAVKAVRLSRNLYEGYFQCAQYSAKLGLYGDAIYYLAEAIKGDRYYAIKVQSEKDFDVMKDHLQLFFEKSRKNAKSIAERGIGKAEEIIRDAEPYCVRSDKLGPAINELNKAKEFLKRESLFDCVDAILKAQKAYKTTVKLLIDFLHSQISEITNGFEQKDKALLKRLYNINDSSIIFFVLAFPLAYFTGSAVSSIWVGILSFFAWWIGLAFIVCSIYEGKIQAQREENKKSYENKLAVLGAKLSEAQTKYSNFEEVLAGGVFGDQIF